MFKEPSNVILNPKIEWELIHSIDLNRIMVSNMPYSFSSIIEISRCARGWRKRSPAQNVPLPISCVVKVQQVKEQ